MNKTKNTLRKNLGDIVVRKEIRKNLLAERSQRRQERFSRIQYEKNYRCFKETVRMLKIIIKEKKKKTNATMNNKKLSYLERFWYQKYKQLLDRRRELVNDIVYSDYEYISKDRKRAFNAINKHLRQVDQLKIRFTFGRTQRLLNNSRLTKKQFMCHVYKKVQETWQLETFEHLYKAWDYDVLDEDDDVTETERLLELD